jgi:hypothetical protein
MAGREGETRTIASSMLLHVCPWQGHRRPTPRFCVTGEVIDFALVTIYGLNSGTEAGNCFARDDTELGPQLEETFTRRAVRETAET